MAEKVKIRVHPSGTATDLLTVSDAMRQVLDFVELLDKADTPESTSNKVVWRLAYASTNSPFEVSAEATSADPTISVAAKAHFAKLAVRGAFGDLLSGQPPPDWFDDASLKVAERIFARNLNGIGRTDLDFGEAIEPAIIVHANAKVAALAIDQSRLDAESAVLDLTRTEYGSFEGEILSTSSFHSSPSLVVRDRLTEEKVVCVFSHEVAQIVGGSHTWLEVWSGKRVLVSGALHYDRDGLLKKVDAYDLDVIDPPDIHLNEAREADFLTGLSVAEFLDRGWG